MAINTGQIDLLLVDDKSKIPTTALSGRTSLSIKATEDIYIGSSAVTSSNGILVPSGRTVTIAASDNVYALATVAATVVTYIESDE